MIHTIPLCVSLPLHQKIGGGECHNVYIRKERSQYAQKSTRLEVLHSTFEENRILPDTIKLNDFLIRDIKKYADAVLDYRYPPYTKHPLGDIIMLVFFAVLENANERGARFRNTN